MKKIVFPKTIKNDFETIKFFNNLLGDSDKEIFYCMENVKFFDASMVTYFHSINRQLYKTHEKIFYDKIQDEIEDFFLKNKFAEDFSKKYLNLKLEDKHKTYVEFTKIYKDNEDAFYTIQENIKEKKLINFNNEMQATFLALVGEMANNSHEHGNINVAYFCGQYFPRIKRLSFSISNLGNTIVENVKSKESNFSNLECFKWIFKLGTTTRKDGTSGGQGLYELKNLVKKLNGDITIISGYDYFYIDKEQKEKYERLENKYSGTTFIINIIYDRGVEYENIKN